MVLKSYNVHVFLNSFELIIFQTMELSSFIHLTTYHLLNIFVDILNIFIIVHSFFFFFERAYIVLIFYLVMARYQYK